LSPEIKKPQKETNIGLNLWDRFFKKAEIPQTEMPHIKKGTVIKVENFKAYRLFGHYD